MSKQYKSITDENSYQKKMLEFLQREIHRQDIEALWFLLKSKEGRWFLMRLLDETRIHAKTFTGNSNTFYNEGRRDVGIGILSSIAELGIEAIKYKQKAEIEYVQSQMKARELAKDNLENKED